MCPVNFNPRDFYVSEFMYQCMCTYKHNRYSNTHKRAHTRTHAPNTKLSIEYNSSSYVLKSLPIFSAYNTIGHILVNHFRTDGKCLSDMIYYGFVDFTRL